MRKHRGLNPLNVTTTLDGLRHLAFTAGLSPSGEKATAMTNPNLLTSEEAAEYVGVSLDFARRKLKHEVPYVQHKPRGPMRFWRQDLDRWLAEHTVQPVR